MKLAVIHTTPVTIPVLKALSNEIIGDCEIINIMDDSILPQLAANGGNIDEIAERWIYYAQTAEKAGATCILNACSSVGEMAVRAQSAVSIPIIRIDEAMAEEAVRRGTRIGVAATLRTTLNPTLQLLQSKSVQSAHKIELVPILVEDAYKKLIQGDQAGHDETLSEALRKLAGSVDVVVLAQASMERVVEFLPAGERNKFLSSPRSGMERVKRIVEGTAI